MAKGLPKRSEDYALWYNDLVKKASLAGAFIGSWLYDYQTARLRYLGEYAIYPRWYV